MGVIVVGYVPKPEGEAALESAMDEARRRHSSIIVVNSLRGFDRSAPGDEDALAPARERLADSGIAHEIRHLDRGQEAAQDLVDVAEQAGAELIVIGLRRRGPSGKLVLGTSSQRILLDAPCPVLAVKPADA